METACPNATKSNSAINDAGPAAKPSITPQMACGLLSPFSREAVEMPMKPKMIASNAGTQNRKIPAIGMSPITKPIVPNISAATARPFVLGRGAS